MRTIPWMLAMLACVGVLLPGCAKKPLASEAAASAFSETMAQSTTSNPGPDRILVWKAYLALEVPSVGEGMRRAIDIAEQFKGYVEHKSDRGAGAASVRLRIPTATLKDAVGALESLGEVSYRRIAAEDVTEQYVDIEARLKNKRELRDRLRQLLQKATDVKDVILIETELNRVQSDIDAMDGKLTLLKGQVDYATVEITLQRKKILGPIGYLLRGVWWGIEKLFVIRN